MRRRLVSEALRAQDPDDREAPFDIEFAQLPPGKRNYPHHSHATEWELYYALSGAGEEAVRLKAGSVTMRPPGLAHQLINNGREDFTYLVISNNAPLTRTTTPTATRCSSAPFWAPTRIIRATSGRSSAAMRAPATSTEKIDGCGVAAISRSVPGARCPVSCCAPPRSQEGIDPQELIQSDKVARHTLEPSRHLK